MAGCWKSASSASSAAPVGVTSSIWAGLGTIWAPLAARMASVAGAGTGNSPCWVRTVPLPVGMGEA